MKQKINIQVKRVAHTVLFCFFISSTSLTAQTTGDLKFIEDIEIGSERILKISTSQEKPIPIQQEKTAETIISSDLESFSLAQFKYAQLMDCEVEKLSNSKLYSCIDQWWNTRYRYGGTDQNGIDCSAFSGTLYKEVFGFQLPRTSKQQYEVIESIERYQLQEADLVFFNTSGSVSHVGVYLINGYFVHASTHSGVTISHLDEAYYQSRFIGGGRIVLNN